MRTSPGFVWPLASSVDVPPLDGMLATAPPTVCSNHRMRQAFPVSPLLALPTLSCAAPDGPALARELGIVTRGHCGLGPIVAAIDPRCERVVGRVEVDASLDPEAAAAAFD